MIIYILLLFLVIIILMIKDSYFYKNNILRSFIFYIILMLLFFVYILRSYNVGTDYKMYYDFFYYSSDLLKELFIEPGYILFNSLAQYNGNFLIIPILVFIICFVGIINLNNILGINKFSFLFFLVTSYLYFSSFNIIRQYLAIGIICIGMSLFFNYYYHNIIKYLIFILSIILAKEFHSTAAFCFIFLLFPHINITKKKILFSGLFTTAFFFTNFIRNIFINLLNLFPNYIQKYGSSTSLTSFGNKGIIQFLPVIIQFIFLYIYVYNNNIKNYKMKFIISGYLLFLVLYSGGGNIIVDRLQAYTYIFPIFYSSMFVSKNNDTKYIYKLMFILFWILYYILRLLLNNSGIVPYTFI